MNLYLLYSICYIAIVGLYTVQTADDIGSKFIVAIQLIYFSRLLSCGNIDIATSRYNNTSFLVTVWLTLAIVIAEFVLKVLCLTDVTQVCSSSLADQLNMECIERLLKFQFGTCEVLFMGTILISVIVLWMVNRYQSTKNLKRVNDTSEFLIKICRFITIALLYGLAYIHSGHLQTVWVCVCCLYTIKGRDSIAALRFIALLLALALFGDYASLDARFTEYTIFQYFYNNEKFNIEFAYSRQLLIIMEIACTAMVGWQILWFVTGQPLAIDRQDRVDDRMSSRLSLRRKKASVEYNTSAYRVFVVHSATLYILLTNTTPGCVVLAIALPMNLPQVKTNYRPLLLVGATLSLIYEPNNIILMGYLLLVTFLKVLPMAIRTYPLFWITESLRILILFSSVSIINFVTGLFRQQYLIQLAIIMRIVSRLFDYNNEIIGLNDSYGIWSSNHAIRDTFLWALLIAIKMDGDSATTNMVLLWLFKKLQCILHIFRYFHWLAYITACFLVLSADQSLFSLVEFAMVLGLICSQMFLKGMNKNIWLRRLWSIEINWLMVKIAVKYFYLFSQYSPDWGIFQAMRKYQRLIGLAKADTQPSKAFIEQCLMLVVALLSRYIQNIKITYRLNRPQTYHERHQQQQSIVTDKKTNTSSAFSRVRLSIIEKDLDDIAYVYENFIAPRKNSQMGQLASLIYRILTKPLLQINFLVIILIYLLGDRQIEYILYAVIMTVYYIRVNLMSGNSHEQFIIVQEMIDQNSSQPQKLDQMKQQINQTSLKAFRISSQANLFTIIVSAAIILLNYLRILFNAMYFGEYENQYKFVDILPQFIIVIISILVKQLSPQIEQYQVVSKKLVMHLSDNDKQIIFQIGLTLIKILQRLLLVYFATLLLNFDMSSLLALIMLVAFVLGVVREQTFVAAASVVALVGLALGQASCIGVLLLGRIELYLKFKMNQTIIHNLPNNRNISRHENAYNCLVRYMPTLLGLMVLSVCIYSLKTTNLPLFIGIMVCIVYKEIFKGSIESVRQVILFMFSYAGSLFLIKIYKSAINEEFWIDRGSLFVMGSLMSLNIDLMASQKANNRAQLGERYIQNKGKLVSQLLGYLKNEFKLESLKRFYIEKRSLSDKITKIKRQLESSRRENLNSFGRLVLEQEQEREDNYARLFNSVFFYPIPKLHELLGSFHHYMGQDLLLNQHIDIMKKNIIEGFKISFNATLNRINAQLNISSSLERSLIPVSHSAILKQPSENIPIDPLKSCSIPSIDHTLAPLIRRIQSIQQLTSIQRQNNYQQYHLALLKRFMPQSDQRIIQLIKYMISNFNYVGFVALIGWNFSGGVYTLPANILIFAWAIPLQGKTPAKFWIFILYYLVVILSIKFCLPLLPESVLLNFIFSTAKTKCVYEYLLVVVSVVELIVGGMYGNNANNQAEDINESLFRTALNRASFGITHPKQDEYFLKYYKQFRKHDRLNFFEELFSKFNLKPGRDFYPLIASSQVIIFLYIFFFYDMVEYENKQNATTLQDMLSYNQFSKHMVVALFLQMLVMIADRFVTTYNYYDRGEQQLQGFLLKYTFDPTLNAQPNLNKPIILKSKYDIPLVIKYILHVLVLAGVNLFVFMYIPSGGRGSMQSQCLNQNQQQICVQKFFYLMGFFGLYLIYFFFNAQQIRYGFTRLKGKNTLMTSYHFLNMYLYKTFMAIPFLSEFKKLADWTLTSTGLPLFHWLKFEDMHSRLYVCKCQTEMLRRKPFGVETWWVRYIIAPAGFISIILIIFGPLIIYSTANPFAVKDQVIGAQVSLTLRINGITNYDMFQTSHFEPIKKVQDSNDSNSELYGNNEKSLFYIQMNKYPDFNLLLSEPVMNSIVKKINDRLQVKSNTTFNLVLIVDIIEKEGGKSKHEWAIYPLQGNALIEFSELLSGKKSQLQIKEFYSPLPGRMKNFPLLIRSREKYWEVSSNGEILPLYYITTSKFKNQFGVVTFYLTYVLLISRLMRIYLVANVENVVFEGSEVERVLYLCSAVISARRLENFEEEEYFYFELMDLIRAPEKMYQTTGSLKQFRLRC